MLIDLAQLRTFVAVAEEQHLTRAADRLHLSPSTASAHVRAVEEALGLPLFARANRNLELTRAGAAVLARARSLLADATLFASFARELRGRLEGQLVVGSNSEPGSSRIGRIVATLRERCPLVAVELRARASAGARHALKTGEFDVGVLLGRPVDPSITHYRLTTVPFRVAGPAAWADRIEEADWTALARMPWIGPSDSSAAYGTMMRQLFDERGLEPDVVVRFDNAALGRDMLEAGVGLMLVRDDHARQGLERGAIAVSRIAHAELPLHLAHLASRRDDPLVRAFIDAAGVAWPALRVVAPTDG